MTAHNITDTMDTTNHHTGINPADPDTALCYAVVDLDASAQVVTVFDATEKDIAQAMLRDKTATTRGIWSMRTLRGELAVKVWEKYNAAIDALMDLPRCPTDAQKSAVTAQYAECRRWVLGL